MAMDQAFSLQPVLEIRGLNKSLSGKPILRDISLTTYAGEIFGFLGPNGSGKTTTIKLMLGLLRLESGEISICGNDIRAHFEEAMANVGGIIENPEMYKYLSGRENLECYARMYDHLPKERIDEVLRMVGLSERQNEKIARYSLGMRQRLGVAQALLNSPRLLVLDEPTNGLDPAGIKDLRDTLKYVSHELGVSVFISSHLLSELDQLCDRVAIIDRGKVLGTMTMEEIRNQGGDNETASFTFLRPEKAMEIFARLEIPVSPDEGGAIHATMRRGTLPDAVAVLAAEGAGITSVIPVKRSLEDAFLAVTEGYEGGARQ